MRCRYCGQRIPEGELYCRHCGKEVRIVPDYNPLDDMLTAQIKGAIDSDGYEDEMYYSRPSRNRDAAGRSTTGSRRGNERRSTGVQDKKHFAKKRKSVHCFSHCPCYLS